VNSSLSKLNSQSITLPPKLVLFVVLLLSAACYSQPSLDSVLGKIDPDKLAASVGKKLSKLEEKIVAKSVKTLEHLERQEERVYEKQLTTKDSVEARLKLDEIQNRYKALDKKLKNPSAVTSLNIRQYIPRLDSLTSAFKFLDQSGTTTNVKNALAKVESFNDKFQQAQAIKDFIRERKEILQKEFEQLGMFKELKQLNKEVYYYSEQLKEYKQILSDPNKLERKVIELLSKTKPFQDFMRKNSMLASLFRLPGDPNDPGYIASLAGLQTRVQVNNLLQQQLASGGPNAQAQFQQGIQQAQSQMQELKNKLMQFGRGNSDDIMPEGFRPNSQKTKSFLKRLEYGTDFQAQRSTNFFPATTDLGLSVGYKLNDKSIIGVGASYKVGLGRGWNNMELSSQGAGLRSYVDWKLKKSIWISGGYEMNYRSEFKNINQLKDITAWQQSGLVGLSKVIDVKSKFFKKTKLQLLWDFLSYQQVPRTQPLIFRISYSLK
jgi:hypothetical protein